MLMLTLHLGGGQDFTSDYRLSHKCPIMTNPCFEWRHLLTIPISFRVFFLVGDANMFRERGQHTSFQFWASTILLKVFDVLACMCFLMNLQKFLRSTIFFPL